MSKCQKDKSQMNYKIALCRQYLFIVRIYAFDFPTLFIHLTSGSYIFFL